MEAMMMVVMLMIHKLLENTDYFVPFLVPTEAPEVLFCSNSTGTNLNESPCHIISILIP